MSETLKKLGINLEYFPRDLENEAVEQLTSLRMEHILQGENLKFNWNNLLQRPELIELNTEKERNSQFQQELVFDGEEDQEWIYAQTSLFIFSQKSLFRKNIIEILKQKHFDYLRLMFAILNMVAYCIFDYKFRVDHHYPNINRVSVGLEVLCNIFFGFEMALQIIAQGLILEKGTYLRNGWNFVNFIAFLTGWSVLYDNSSKQEFLKFCRATRLLRCGRVIYDIPVLKNQMNAFVGSFPKLGAIIIPLLFVMFFYAIVGLHVFQGITEYRCRETPEPDFEKHEWVAAEIENLCGIWQCPEGTYCGSPADYGIPRNFNEGQTEIFNFGYARFDDIFYSILVIFTYLNVTGWSGTVFFYWKAVSTYLTGFFFVTLIFLLAYVLSNLLLATFYESFMVQSSIKQNKKAKQEEEQLENEIQKKRQQQMVERLAVMGETQIIGSKSRLQTKVSMYFNQEELQNTEEREKGAFKKSQRLSVQISKSIYFIMLNCLFIALDTIALCMDYHGIAYNDWKTLQIIDFICMIYFFVELTINVWGKGFKLYLKKHINLFDTLVITSQIALCFYCFIQRLPIIVNDDVNVQLWKSIKILKILKLLYSAKIFHTISVLIRCLVETCIKIKNMIYLFLMLGLIIAIFGRELFGQKIKFIGEADGLYDPKGESLSINYDTLGSALTAAFNIFYNEEWHVNMFAQAKVEKISSLMFYIIAIIMGQVFFVRLLMAVFLNEFCQCLNRVDQSLKPFHHNKQVQDLFMTIQSIFTKKKIKSQGLDNSDKKENNKLIDSSSPKQQLQDEQIEYPVKKQSLLNKFNSADQNPNNIFQKIQQEEEDQNVIMGQKNQIKSPDNENENLNSDQEKSAPIVFDQKDIVQSAKFKQERSNLQALLLPIVDSIFMKAFVFILNIGTGIRVALMNPLEDPHSQQSNILEILFIILTSLYAILTIMNILARGFYSGDDSFIKHNPVNLLLFLISVFEIITLIFSIDHPLASLVNSLRLFQFIQVASEFNSDIRYAIVSLINSFTKMIQLVLFCFFVLLAYGLFPMKLLKGQLFYCTTLDESIPIEKIENKFDCFDYGGSWVNQILNYDNIFSSILLLFVTTTTENWLPLLKYTWSANGVDQQPKQYNNLWWTSYYQIYFFIGFVLMLNMFIGLIVNTYDESKLKASNLHLLDDTQREFFLIKRQIYLMKPIVKGYEPTNQFRLFLFKIIKNKTFKQASILIIIFNIFILCLYYHRQDKDFREALDIINIIFIGIFGFEILIRFIARGFESYFKDFSNTTDLVLYWFCIANLIIRNDETVDFQARKYLQGIGVAYQLLRGYRIIKRFNPIEKLFQSIFSVIPSAFAMLIIMFIFVYIYTSLGMDMFAYLRPQSDGVNGFDMHFKKFTSGMFTLIKVASAEEWWNVLINCVKTIRPDFHCIEITTYEEFLQYGYNGCGTVYAYIYYIFFHLVFSLMLLNVFIASVLGAYAEHVKSAESAISKYQLNDVIRLWSSYDRQGVGFIDYKFFWKLSSEIAIIFGVNQSDLLDQNNKKNFLKVLNIPIFENTADNKLCYKFHDVIQSLTKISVTLKYGVSNLEPTDPEIIEKLDKQLHKHDYGKITFRTTPFSSGDMSSIIWIQKKVRMLRKRLKGEKIGEIGDLNKVIKENK